MTRKATAKKQPFCLESMPILKSKKGFSRHHPQAFFKSYKKVAEALLQSLKENDAGAFREILNTYLQI